MFNVKDGLAFKRNDDGSVTIVRDGVIITTLTQDDWISVITAMVKVNRDLAQIHQIAKMFHTGAPGLRINTPKSNISIKFLCKCKKEEGWVTDGEITSPCPGCGRVYEGKYSSKHLTIIAKEIKGRSV